MLYIVTAVAQGFPPNTYSEQRRYLFKVEANTWEEACSIIKSLPITGIQDFVQAAPIDAVSPWILNVVEDISSEHGEYGEYMVMHEYTTYWVKRTYGREPKVRLVATHQLSLLDM